MIYISLEKEKRYTSQFVQVAENMFSNIYISQFVQETENVFFNM